MVSSLSLMMVLLEVETMNDQFILIFQKLLGGRRILARAIGPISYEEAEEIQMEQKDPDECDIVKLESLDEFYDS